MNDERYLNAQEAAKLLGITTATLYSYVSRGLVRSEASSGKSRARKYVATDIYALKERNEQRRNPTRSAAQALSFGSPVLESSITLIENGGLYYRGKDVVELVRSSSFEAVSSLLWTGTLESEALFDRAQRPLLPDSTMRAAIASMPPLDAFQTLLLSAGDRDLAAFNTAPLAVAETGVRLLRLLAWTVTGEESSQTLARQLAEHWAPESSAATSLIDAALILCADHGLNISSFTARCVASAGTQPYLAVNAALCALRGHRHGGQTDRVSTFLDQAASSPSTAVAENLKSGLFVPGSLPGFGHPLYPDGDPRGFCLLDMIRDQMPHAPVLSLADEIIRIADKDLGIVPTIDFGLVLLARALNLPDGAPLLLFAMGRIAGWVGQIVEEYQRGTLIRPRADYVGARPAM